MLPIGKYITPALWSGGSLSLMQEQIRWIQSLITKKKLHNPPDVIKIFLGFQPQGPCVPWDLLHNLMKPCIGNEAFF